MLSVVQYNILLVSKMQVYILDVLCSNLGQCMSFPYNISTTTKISISTLHTLIAEAIINISNLMYYLYEIIITGVI